MEVWRKVFREAKELSGLTLAQPVLRPGCPTQHPTHQPPTLAARIMALSLRAVLGSFPCPRLLLTWAEPLAAASDCLACPSAIALLCTACCQEVTLLACHD